MSQFQAFSIGVWVGAGTRHEAPGEEGMSHFLEHMMFKGTARRSALEIATSVDRVGGEFNAFTAREYTCFHLLMLSKNVELAVDLMSDVLVNSKFAEEEIERERKVILQEISMVEDNPEELVHDVFFEQALGKHPLGKPILGTPKTVSNFKRDSVYSFYRRHYSPKQLLISAVGDIEHEKVEKLLNRALKKSNFLGTGALKSRNLSLPRMMAGSKIIPRDHEQAHLVIGFPSLAYDDPDRFAALLLNVYLGGGMSSALFQEIREKRGLAYNVYSNLSPFSDCGLFSVYVGTNAEGVETSLAVTGKELKKLRETVLPKQMLEILKDNLTGTILLNQDSVESRMSSIARNQMFFGRYYPVDKIIKDLKAVSPERVAAVAKRILQPKRTVLTALGPVKKEKKAALLKRLLA